MTAELASFIANSRNRALPPDVTRLASRAFVNWVGCALGAADDPSVTSARRVISALSAGGPASAVGRNERLDAVNAALINGIAANALDYDDMHVPTLIHPTGAVVAAALSLGEDRHVSGQVLVAAIVTGIEVECRLGRALFPQHYDAGWHITATLGSLGAAAAASVVLGIDAGRTARALGIAATQASGLRAMLPNACKSFNIGKAAAAGVLSALLAEAGFDSDADVLEAKFGLFDVFGEPADPAAISRDLGVRFVLPEVSLKPYPCGVVIHPLIDACLEITREPAFDAGSIVAMTAAVHPRALELAGRRHPESAIAGRFSLYHAAALALTRRSAGLADFDETHVNDPRSIGLRERMTIAGDAALLPRQARVRVELANGSCLEQAIEHPSGSPERPLSDEQLRAKFMTLAARAVDGQRAARLFEACIDVDRLADVATLRDRWKVKT